MDAGCRPIWPAINTMAFSGAIVFAWQYGPMQTGAHVEMLLTWRTCEALWTAAVVRSATRFICDESDLSLLRNGKKRGGRGIFFMS